MPYGPTSPLGGIRIFYSLSIPWDSDLSSIRVKWILLNLTLGSRYHFHPESPLLLMIVCCTWRPWRYSPLLTRELMFIAFAIPLPPSTLMDNYLQLLFLPSSPVGLVITRYLETLIIVSIILWAYRLAVPCHLNTPMDNSRTYRVSAHPQLFISFTKVFEIPFDIPKILSNLLLWNFLFAFIMINPISIEILLTFLVIIILSLLTQYVCEYTQSSLIIINYFSGWAAILLTGIGSRPIQLSLIVP